MEPAVELWSHLRQVSTVSFNAHNQNEPCWRGTAYGAVVTESPSENVIVTSESGKWNPERGRQAPFTNVFRWTMLGPDRVRLEHLRFGPENPVHLFDLGPDEHGNWIPLSPHPCREDCYSAEVRLHADGVDVHWSITGPKKQQSIKYEYRSKCLPE